MFKEKMLHHGKMACTKNGTECTEVQGVTDIHNKLFLFLYIYKAFDCFVQERNGSGMVLTQLYLRPYVNNL